MWLELSRNMRVKVDDAFHAEAFKHIEMSPGIVLIFFFQDSVLTVWKYLEIRELEATVFHFNDSSEVTLIIDGDEICHYK